MYSIVEVIVCYQSTKAHLVQATSGASHLTCNSSMGIRLILTNASTKNTKQLLQNLKSKLYFLVKKVM